MPHRQTNKYCHKSQCKGHSITPISQIASLYPSSLMSSQLSKLHSCKRSPWCTHTRTSVLAAAQAHAVTFGQPRSGQAAGLDDRCRSLPTKLFYSTLSRACSRSSQMCVRGARWWTELHPAQLHPSALDISTMRP